jgi:hypothetical protein
MSIVALKRKTEAKYNNMSVGVPQFSLNGTHRSQGYVGQDTRGRSLPKTLMKGNVLKGHGGCCGTYRITPIVQSAVTSTNNPNVIKNSVLNTNGLIMTKYRWIRRPQPYTSVKPDSASFLLQHTQQGNIERIVQNTITSAANPKCQTNPPTATCKNPIFNKSFKDYQVNAFTPICNKTKDLSDPYASNIINGHAMNQGTYIQYLDRQCGNYDEYKVKNINGAPLPGNGSVL